MWDRKISANADFTMLSCLFNTIVKRYHWTTWCQSLRKFISKKEERKEYTYPKKRMYVCTSRLGKPVVKPPWGVNTTVFTTYSWDWLPSRAKHLFLLSLTFFHTDDSCSRTALWRLHKRSDFSTLPNAECMHTFDVYMKCHIESANNMIVEIFMTRINKQ